MIYKWIETIQKVILVSKPHRNKINAAIVVIGGLAIVGFINRRKRVGARITHEKNEAAQGRKKSVAINKDFFKNLRRLLGIVIPGIRSKEMLLVIIHSFFLVARTVASVYLAVLDGRIVKALVSGNGKDFSMQIGLWLVSSVPIAFTNSAIKYLQGKLAIAFRTRLTNYVHKEYMDNYTFYKLENLDSRIKNADQCITQDVAKFCDSLSDLYGNLAKPTLDCIIYNAKLAQNVGWKGLFGLTLCIHVGTLALRKFAPSFGRLVAEEQRLEGNYRFAHSRLITNAEEIAFYGGSSIEKGFLDQSYKELVKHVEKTLITRLEYGTLEDYVVKYYWGALGFLICALPVFSPFGKPVGASLSMTSRTKDFVTNKRLLLNTSDAFGRIMQSYREVSELAGFTARVSDMLNVFDDIKKGHYEKGQSSDAIVSNTTAGNLPGLSKGELVNGDSIVVDNVSVVSPAGDVLVKNLSFQVPLGTHLLIVGPNGCGKSSLFRILGGLWPVYDGVIKKPFNSKRLGSNDVHNEIFYIPQRPYLSVGTLRDQVIYPHTVDEARRNGATDEVLSEVLDNVKLLYIVEREGGWDAKRDWKDVLSGGEKQRIAMARLFYHKTKYAILDECTSAVSIDVEGAMYNTAKSLGISLMTVSHRPSLWKYHDWKLEFDGNGGWKFGKIEDSSANDENPTAAEGSISKLTLEEEKIQLEKRIKADSSRVKKIDALLGNDL